MATLNSNIPNGELIDKWTNYRSSLPLVSPSNKQKLDIIVVGTGLAGASAASSLAEMGYNIKSSGFHIFGVADPVYLSDIPNNRSKGSRYGSLFLFKLTRKMLIALDDHPSSLCTLEMTRVKHFLTLKCYMFLMFYY